MLWLLNTDWNNVGYAGHSCTNICEYNPCENNSTCQLDNSLPKGYKCICNSDTSSGTNPLSKSWICNQIEYLALELNGFSSTIIISAVWGWVIYLFWMSRLKIYHDFRWTLRDPSRSTMPSDMVGLSSVWAL